MLRRSVAGWLSSLGFILGFAMVLAAVVATFETRSARYWPLLVTGLVIGCVSAPFYYYFKAKDRSADPYGDTEITTLNELGKQRGIEAEAEKGTRHGA